jgi:hypothetical protein
MQYIPIKQMGFIPSAIKQMGFIEDGIYSEIYWDVFGQIFWIMNWMVIHLNTSGNASQ